MVPPVAHGKRNLLKVSFKNASLIISLNGLPPSAQENGRCGPIITFHACRYINFSIINAD